MHAAGKMAKRYHPHCLQNWSQLATIYIPTTDKILAKSCYALTSQNTDKQIQFVNR